MAERYAKAKWAGDLKKGKGVMKFADYIGPYTWSSRFEEAEGTNPEELLGAAHAGCFSMALASGLGKAGFPPKQIETEAHVSQGRVDGEARIIAIHLVTEAKVPSISAEEFARVAEAAKIGCPLSVALAAVPSITLDAKLL